MEATKEQQKIIEAEFDEVLLVNAYAGSGKTSTLIKFCEARADKKILYLAYNTALAKESREKFSHLGNVETRTLHSLAYRVKGHQFRNRLGNLRPMDIIEYCSVISKGARYFHAYIMLDVIKGFCNSEFAFEEYREYLIKTRKKFYEKYGLKVDFFVDNVQRVWDELEQNSEKKYEHDFYLKNFQLSKPVLNYDYILIDEAQDINGCIIDILENQNCKKVYIGDTHQSIYGFRGAANSLDIMKRKDDALTLSLTQSFRCPQLLSKDVNLWLRILGSTEEFKGVDKKIGHVGEDSIITYIARTNASIFEQAVSQAIDKKRTLFFVGGIASYNFRDLIDLQLLSQGDKFNIRNPFIKKFDSIADIEQYANEAMEVDLLSKIKIVKNFSNYSIERLVTQITEKTTTQIDSAKSVLTTAHKAKGLEWDNIYIMDDFLKIKSESNKLGGNNSNAIYLDRQELNLIYVAITRTKKNISLPDSLIIKEEWLDRVIKNINVVDTETLKKIIKEKRALEGKKSKTDGQKKRSLMQRISSLRGGKKNK